VSISTWSHLEFAKIRRPDAAKPEKMAEKVLSCVRSEQRLTGGFMDMEQGNGFVYARISFR